MEVEYNDGDSALLLGKIKARWRLDTSKIEARWRYNDGDGTLRLSKIKARQRLEDIITLCEGTIPVLRLSYFYLNLILLESYLHLTSILPNLRAPSLSSYSTFI